MKRIWILITAFLLLSAGFLFADYFIDFETDTSGNKGSYATGEVLLSGLNWEMTQALIGNLAGDKKFDARSARMRRDGTTPGEMVMLEDKVNGLGTISFYYARYGTETDQPNLTVQYSTNQGADWIDIGTISTFPEALTEYSAVLNVEGNIRIRFITDLSGTNQRRLNIDNILVTNFGDTPVVATPTFDPPPGEYYPEVNVEILCTTENATIYYSTTSNTGPWSTYISSINITETTTIWAYATAVDYDDSPVGSATYTIPEPTITNLPYTEDFATGLGDIYTYSVSGPTKYWLWSSTGLYAYMNGFNSGDLEEDWLILPGMNLTGEDVILTFDTWRRYGNDDVNNYFQLLFSTDYLGVGDPSSATWTTLTFNMPAAEQIWTSSGNIDLSGIIGSPVYLAFKYHYNVGMYVSWQVDNINIYEVLSPLLSVNPTSLSDFTYVVGEGPSASQNYELSGINLDPASGSITITGNDFYEVSLDDILFADFVDVPYTNGELTATPIYVRLKAGLATGLYNNEWITNIGGSDSQTVTVNGSVTEEPSIGYFVDFEGPGETKTAYGTGVVTLSGLNWDMTEALIGTLDADWKNGIRSARMRGYAASSMTMLEGKASGIGTVSFNYRRYGTDAQVDWKVEYSSNDGVDWIQIGQPFTAPASDVVQLFSEVVNVDGNIRIRIKRATETGASNNRLNIDDILITDYSDEDIVATPTFNPPGGNYLETQFVTISTVTPDATIYYTLDGQDPDEGSLVFSTPIEISETTTLKARAYATGYLPSSIATTVYIFPVEVANIAELRAGTIGILYKLTGEAILTFQQDFRNNKYIQDATAGILIDDDNGIITTLYDIYDGITDLIGTLGFYGNMYQIVPIIDSGAPTSVNNEVIPIAVTLDDLNNNFMTYQSRLVKVDYTTFTTADGIVTFGNGQTYPINDGIATALFRTTFYDVDYIGYIIPVLPQNIVALPNSRTEGNFLTARDWNDFEEAIIGDAEILSIANINPVNPTVNSPFAVTVQSQDLGGFPASVMTDTEVILSLSTGTGQLSGNLTGTILANENQVIISGVIYDTVESGISLTVTIVSGETLLPGTSALFNVLAPTDHLAFVNLPLMGAPGVPLNTFTVEARRSDNSPDPAFTGDITISQISGPGGISGTLVQNAVAGIATFNDIQFDLAGEYVIAANSPGLTGVTSEPIVISGVPAAIVLQRPLQIDISETTSQSAVLMKVQNYPTDDARYRLYSGTTQYNCWNGTEYVTSTTYANGPQIPGTPTTTSNWWILFQRGGNNSTAASYRDRLGPTYGTNYQTTTLPAATAITEPFFIELAIPLTPVRYDLDLKYVVLGYDQEVGGNLITATSTDLLTGEFFLVVQDETIIRRLEVRTIDNSLMESLIGEWTETTDYYSSVEGLTGMELWIGLKSLTSATHINYSYDAARFYMHGYIDNINDQVRCIYTGQWVDHPYGSLSTPPEFSAEHTYAQSWYGADLTTEEISYAVSDLHALQPARLDVNQARFNYPFDFVTNISSIWGFDDYLSYLGTNAELSTAFDVADEFKGNLARGILYFSIRYYENNDHFVRGNIDLLPILIQWYLEDPVDYIEVLRNEKVYAYQGNRNPFIDRPEFVTLIWGDITPEAPVATLPTVVTDDSFTANWNPAVGAVTYRLDVSESPDFVGFVDGYKNIIVNDTSKEISGLDPSTTYYYRVRALDINGGLSLNSNSIYAITETAPIVGDLIYYWNFNENVPVGENWAQPIPSNIGNGEITYTFTEAISFTGTTINGIEGEVSGGAFVPRPATDLVNNGEHFNMAIPTTGYENIIITYATQRTTTGFTSQQVLYSLNGIDFMELITITDIPTSWAIRTIDFTGVPGVANNPDFKVRIVLDGGTGSTGNNRFDNINVLGHQLGDLLQPPANVTISISNNEVIITWDTVEGATSYIIEAGTDPYGTFTNVTAQGNLLGTTWTGIISEPMKFYRVIAVQ